MALSVVGERGDRVITTIQDEKGIRKEKMKCWGSHGVRKLFIFGQKVILSYIAKDRQDELGSGGGGEGGAEAKSRYTGMRKAQRCRGFTGLFHFPRL